MRRIARSIVASTFLVSIVSLPLLAGCVVSMGGCDWQSAKYTREQVTRVPHVAGGGLDVQTENGKVTIRRGGTDEVTIKATIRATTQERAEAAKVNAGRSAGADASGVDALVVRMDWPESKREPSEGASFEITIPQTAWVRVSTLNGGVTIENLQGTAELKTSNSGIQVNGHQGDVKANTSNGSVRASNVAGSLAAETSNSSVTISDVDGFVRAKTSNGTINLSLAPNSTGPLQLKSSNGSVHLQVPRSFAGTMELKTSNGSIRHDGFSSASYSGSKTSGTLTFGSSGNASSVETSNGSITISPR